MCAVNAEYSYAECHYALSLYADCRGGLKWPRAKRIGCFQISHLEGATTLNMTTLCITHFIRCYF
jgi:hypothetical protein